MSENAMFASGPANRSMPDAAVMPVLLYPDVPAAAQWLCQAFGFAERLRIGSHRVQLQVGDGAIVVAQAARPDLAPAGFGHSVMVRVRDSHRHCAAARAAGAVIIGEPTDQPYGERQYSALDPAGHAWTFSQSLRDVDPASWGGELVSAAS